VCAFALLDRGKNYKLADLKGKYTVLYFYPGDFTSGCTIEAQNFEKNAERIRALGEMMPFPPSPSSRRMTDKWNVHKESVNFPPPLHHVHHESLVLVLSCHPSCGAAIDLI